MTFFSNFYFHKNQIEQDVYVGDLLQCGHKRIFIFMLGWWGSSLDKGTWDQICQPEFSPWDLYVGERKLICKLSSGLHTLALAYVQSLKK